MAECNDRSIILITGATGYVGAHILEQVLDAGYRVRATVRKNRINVMREYYRERFEVVEINDLAKGDYTEALKAVSAVIHTAAPVTGRENAQNTLEAIVGGTMNLVEQAYAAGVRKCIVTSTILIILDLSKPEEIFDSSRCFDENDWNPVLSENSIFEGDRSPSWIYAASKTIAERRLWSFAEAHPEIDITTIHPSLCYGPVVGIHVPGNDPNAPSSPYVLYAKIFKTPGNALPPIPPLHVDVRDLAKAHVLALTSPPTSQVGQKRIPFSAPSFQFAWAAEHVARVRPGLQDRLIDYPAEKDKEGMASVSARRAREVLGFQEFVPWQKTVEDSLDSFFDVEKAWFKV